MPGTDRSSEQAWDTGAGGLYVPEAPAACSQRLLDARNERLPQWSPRVLACLSDPTRLYVDYAQCLAMHVGDSSLYGLVDAYFQYQTSKGGIPDACIAFSGLAQGATGALQVRCPAAPLSQAAASYGQLWPSYRNE